MAAAREEIVGEIYVVRRHIESGCHAELEVAVRGHKAPDGEMVITSSLYRGKPIELTDDELKMARGLLYVVGLPASQEWPS